MCHIFPGDRKASLIEHPPVAGVQGIRGQRRQEVGPQGRGAAQRFIPPPARDGGVVPGQQDSGHLAPAPYPWPGENRALQQAGHRPVAAAERIIGRGLGVAEHPRQQPAYDARCSPSTVAARRFSITPPGSDPSRTVRISRDVTLAPGGYYQTAGCDGSIIHAAISVFKSSTGVAATTEKLGADEQKLAELTAG